MTILLHTLKAGWEGTTRCYKDNTFSFANPFSNNSECTISPINQISDLDGIKVYPNPTNEILHIDLANSNNQSATLYNAAGIATIRYVLNEKTNIISLAKLPSGLYWLHLQTEKGYAVEKIVKQ